MAFDWDVLNPADNSFIADYPSNARAFRVDSRGAVDADHFADTSGLHRRVSMLPLGADPTLVGLNGFLYTKTDAGRTELFYQDDNGTVSQVTSATGIAPDKVSKSGDVMTGLLTMTAASIRLDNGQPLFGIDGGAFTKTICGISGNDVLFGDELLFAPGVLKLLAPNANSFFVDFVGSGGQSEIWHEKNDGAGSGLDADLLDGLQPDSDSDDVGDDRHMLVTGNFLICYGVQVMSDSDSVAVTFSKAFTSTPTIVIGQNVEVGNINANQTAYRRSASSATGFTLVTGVNAGGIYEYSAFGRPV